MFYVGYLFLVLGLVLFVLTIVGSGGAIIAAIVYRYK